MEGASAALAGDSQDRSHRAGGARGAFANLCFVGLFILFVYLSVYLFDFISVCSFDDLYLHMLDISGEERLHRAGGARGAFANLCLLCFCLYLFVSSSCHAQLLVYRHRPFFYFSLRPLSFQFFRHASVSCTYPCQSVRPFVRPLVSDFHSVSVSGRPRRKVKKSGPQLFFNFGLCTIS